jgi:transcriptional regulator with XRE-family HTH domain
MHPLKAYLTEQGITVEDFAALMKRLCRGRATKPGYLSQIMGGHRYPSRALAKVIETTSGGRVPAAALLTFERPVRVKEPRRAKRRAAAS